MTKKTDIIQEEILKKFMYNEKLKYNEIWDKKICSSSNFDYHLKQFLIEDILKKEDEYYVLTSKGTRKITQIDGKSLKDNKKPVACAFILVKNDKGQILFSIRKKQPYFDTLNIPGGKIEFGEFSNECALRELLEETGLSCDIKLKLITEKITYNRDEENKIEHNIIGYFYIGENPKGKLLEKTREGDNIFIEPKDISKYKRFPDLDYLVPKLLEKNDKITIANFKRYREKGEFVDYEVIENCL